MIGVPFWSKVDQQGAVPDYAPDLGRCWIWTGRLTTHGYARYAKGKRMLGHRVAYMELVGPIPEGLTLDHLCRVILCVNPAHLEPVTQAENTRRQNAVITHCPQDHPYSGDNVRIDLRSDGRWGRACRACARERARVAYRRRATHTPTGEQP